MLGRKTRSEAAQETPSAPQEAWLTLADGAKIRCAVFEDPHRDAEGLRQFWLEPVRELAGGESVVAVGLDNLPGRSVVHVVWPSKGHHIHHSPTHLSWEDAQGRRYTNDSGLGIIGDVDGGFTDPPGLQNPGDRG